MPQVVVLPVVACDNAMGENRPSPEGVTRKFYALRCSPLDRGVTTMLRAAPSFAKNLRVTRRRA